MKNKYHLCLVILLIGSIYSGYSQNEYLVGYDKEIKGTNFTYHSPYSHNEKCFLVRANKDFPTIEWETQSVPVDYANKTISFIWLYGIDVLSNKQKFKLYLNDQFALEFSSPTNNDQKIWKVKGANNIELSFHQSMIDKYKDQMGFAVLTLPTNLVTKGEPINIKVAGVNNQSDAWYMTYKIPLEKEYSAKQLNVVAKEGSKLHHVIRFNVVHLGEAIEAPITIEKNQKSYLLQTGLNQIDILIPKVNRDTKLSSSIKIGNKIYNQEVVVSPIKEWTVDLVQHSHTDIGYTRPQSEILAEHLRYIDNALDFCDQTDQYPKEAQFRWTCEAAWTVREYINSRPKSQIDRLLRRIKEGRIEVTGMFFNFSEIIDETALAIQMQTIKEFKDMGINVRSAMQNDVNGIGWCMVDLFHNTGVKYLTMGQHGHRARIPFDKPTSFWWESPSGKRLLAYRSEHYMHGNTLSLTSGNIDVFRNNISDYLLTLESKEYPLNRIALQFSGYITDNSPPSTKASDIVNEWNEKYEWPKLKLSLSSDFMLYLEKNHSDHLESKKVAWPDWWTDGFGSAMNETKTSRITHSNLIATMGLLSMAKVAGAQIPEELTNELEDCYDNLLFYDEHTFGAAESISDPTSENSINQWRQKASYVWSANQQSNLLREKAIGLIQPHTEKLNEPSVTVFNTLNWERSGVIEVFIDHDILPLDKAFKIVDSNGNSVPTQLLSSRNEGSKWALWVEKIPPLGYATFKILVSNEVHEVIPQKNSVSKTLENEYYKLTLNSNGIASLFDKKLKKHLVDNGKNLGSFILEKLKDRSEMERLTYLNRDTIYRPLSKTITTVENFNVTKTKEGSIWNSIFLNGQLPELTDDNGITIEIRLYHQTKKTELLYTINKKANTNPESVYIAFPFNFNENGKLAFDVQGGLVYPGENQLEGTASDWNVIQNFATVKSKNSQIVFSSNDIPLVQFGAINTGRYYYKNIPKNGHIYSWVFNNYWTTNFRASQHGTLKWKYQITSSSDNSISFATRFGWENKVPMISRANPGNIMATENKPKSFIDLHSPSNLLLVNSRLSSDGKSVLLHLRETEGDHAILDITKILQNPAILSITEVNGLEETIKTLRKPLLIEHFETKFIRLELKN